MASILVVDDDRDILMLITAVFEAGGHEVVSSFDSREALTLAKSHQVEAVVLDLVMPEFSGREVLAAIREDPETRRLPVVMVSSLLEGSVRFELLEEGATDFVAKPFDPAELLKRVEGSIEESRRLRLPPLARAEEYGRYRVEGVLGEGGQGLVYRARDPELDRLVAIKTIKVSLPGTEAEVLEGSLRLEARAIARCRHPNIVEVYDLGHFDDEVWIAIELVEGTDLGKALAEQGQLTIDASLAIGIALAGALESAHAENIVHQDLKPANVLLGHRGEIKLADFGIARARGEARGHDGVEGSPGFIAPEYFSGSGASPSGDLFSLGVVLYQALCGRLPHEGRSIVERMLATLRQQPLPMKRMGEPVPRRLEALIFQLLEKVPEKRPADATLVRRELRRIGPLIEPRWLPLEQAGTVRLDL